MTGNRQPLSAELFAAGPARDQRFVVVDRWIDCVNLPPGHPQRTLEFTHRQMNEEVNGLEASAQSLCDFPTADWDTRMGLARQCADEARHAAMFRTLLEARGGRVGQFPVLNFQYRIIAHIGTLVGRLTVQNQSFEAGGIDAIDVAIQSTRDEGDRELQALFEAQLADEILHVRFANTAIDAMKQRQPRSVLDMGAALAVAARAFREVMGQEGTDGVRYPVAAGARGEAGFSDRAIQRAEQLAAELKQRDRP